MKKCSRHGNNGISRMRRFFVPRKDLYENEFERERVRGRRTGSFHFFPFFSRTLLLLQTIFPLTLLMLEKEGNFIPRRWLEEKKREPFLHHIETGSRVCVKTRYSTSFLIRTKEGILLRSRPTYGQWLLCHPCEIVPSHHVS